MVDLYQDFEVVRAKPKLYRPPLAVNFNPAAWQTAHLMDITGPYAYALNLPQIAECKPGNLLTSPMLEDLLPCTARTVPESPAELESKMIADGLFYHDVAPKQGHVLGFFLKPRAQSKPAELLYIRRDSNNLWSYREITEEGGCRKPYKPRQLDFNGAPVKDAMKADFGRFTQCLGFASIPYAGIEYYRRIVLPPADMRPFHRATPAEIVLGMR